MANRPNKGFKLGLLMYGAGALFFIAIATQARVQVFRRQETLDQAKKMTHYQLDRRDYARRGSILTADGKALAQDEDAYQLTVDYGKIPHTDAFYMALGQAGGVPASEIAQLSSRPSASWPQPVSAEQRDAIDQVKAVWRADGVSLRRIDKREYPLGEAAAPMVGLCRLQRDKNDNVSGDHSIGMERMFASYLAGKDGETIGLVDRGGAFLPMDSEVAHAKVDGETLLTTIDSDIQMTAAEAVKAAVTHDKGADMGIAVVMNPETGDVMAMASYPSFDPNREANDAAVGETQSHIDAAGMASLEPGSMFKILTLAKALDAGVVKPGETFDCTGSLTVGGRVLHCDEHRSHGVITPDQAIAESCNLDAATWAMRIGYAPMSAFIDQLGLLKPTGVGIPNEFHGLFAKQAAGWKVQLATVGFGQSITATPIELISALSVIANDGIRMKPRLVQRHGNSVIPVQSLGRVLSAQSCQTVRRYMQDVIQSDYGTGKALRIPGYCLAGKTGTAQKIGKNETGHVSNFVGFVPADHPRAVILVMVNIPNGDEYHGAAVAGPAFRQIALAVINRLALPKTENPEIVAKASAPAPAPLPAKVNASQTEVEGEAAQAIAPSGPAPHRRHRAKLKHAPDLEVTVSK
jgi:cell division protein FtsI/penicillin-binding protein 2